ncbi:hypothetical protein CMI37_33030 [Candidatus Pacearchaeota archaeon]|nr:hypothetical protein [Candidatus Pacearchaeota archaeon]|tara:strand:+ start:66 stop:701 length:636 start_codon:yes stop_codon:yes gene_type:complete
MNTPEEVEQRVSDNGGLVGAVLRRSKFGIARKDIEDIKAAGVFGLFMAARGYDLNHLSHARFSTYAWRFILGEVYVEKARVLGLSIRAAYSKDKGSVFPLEFMEHYSSNDINRWVHGKDYVYSRSSREVDPSQEAEQREVYAILEEELGNLHPVEREILERYFCEGESYKKIGKTVIGKHGHSVSGTRVKQIIRKVIPKLRKRLEGRGVGV